MPGEFRRDQNWIGSPNAPIERATFVPPAVPDMQSALADFERYLHEEHGLPARDLVRHRQRLVGHFQQAGLLNEVTGGRRKRSFRYDPYLALLRDDEP